MTLYIILGSRVITDSLFHCSPPPPVNSVHVPLIPLRVTACLVVLGLASRLLIITCVSATVTHLMTATFPYFVGVGMGGAT